MTSLDLSIIIVSWNVKDRLHKNLQSLFSSDLDFTYEVIVIDNNSSDDTALMIKKDFPQVKLISNQANLGFAKACNQGIKQAKGAFILLLNPDMILFKNTLKESLKMAKQNPQAVVSGIKLIDKNGETLNQVRRFPKLFDQLVVVSKIAHLWPSLLNKYLVKDFNYNKSAKVDSIRGSYFLINKLAWQKISQKELPLLDEAYFLWFEEVDFCRQVYENNGAVYYFPSATCLDYVGNSFSQVNTKKKQRYFRDSMLYYFKKWQGKYQYYCLKLTWILIFGILSIFLKLKKSK
jgi:GT2 family glycosyltransferase